MLNGDTARHGATSNKKAKLQTKYDLLHAISRNLNMGTIKTPSADTPPTRAPLNVDTEVDSSESSDFCSNSSSYSSTGSCSDSQCTQCSLRPKLGDESGDGNKAAEGEPYDDIPDQAWLEELKELATFSEFKYTRDIFLPPFPDVDDNNVLESGSTIFGISLKNDAWVEFSNNYYLLLAEIDSISDYWYSLLVDNKKIWHGVLSQTMEWHLQRKHPMDAGEQERMHKCTLDCITMDPTDVTNGKHFCLIYYNKIQNASMVLYNRLVQYYLAGHSINVFTRLVKCKEFRDANDMTYVPGVTTTMSVALFTCLQKLRLVCRFKTIHPQDIFEFTLGHYEKQVCVKRSANYGMKSKHCKIGNGYFYDMDFDTFFTLVDEFTEHWNSCYVDNNYTIYLNLLLDRIALFYIANNNQAELSRGHAYFDPRITRSETGDKEVHYMPNFKASFKMDLHCHVFLEKANFNKMYNKISWLEFEKKTAIDMGDREKKCQYFKDLRTFMKLWILYKLQTVNDQLNDDIGDRYQENFVTKFQSDWFSFQKREIEVDLTYHASKTPKILLKQIKPTTCNEIIDASTDGLTKLFLSKRVDPKMRGYIDWLRIYLLLNMFVESCTNIAGRNSPYVLHANQMGINYNWFQYDKFPFIYYCGGRYHVYYEGCTVYAHDVPYDFLTMVRRECVNNSKNIKLMGREEKEKLLNDIHRSLHTRPDINDDHWYLSGTLPDLIDKLDIDNIFHFYEKNTNNNDDGDNNSKLGVSNDDGGDVSNDSSDGRRSPTIDDACVTGHSVSASDLPQVDGTHALDYAGVETLLDATLDHMIEETDEIGEKLFGSSWVDGDTLYDTLLVWICIVFNCMKSTRIYEIIKSGLVRSCEILEERIKFVKSTHINLKKKLTFISDFKERTRRIECLF